ncbi:hypothetical protein MTO96_045393 [Rhipicephalus appendiculatus]
MQHVSTPDVSALSEAAGFTECPTFTLSMLEEVKLPSKLWCRLSCSDEGVLFATTSVRRNSKLEIFHEKSVLFWANEGKVSAQMFLCGVLCGDFAIHSVAVASRVLQEADDSPICNGAMTKLELSEMSAILTAQLRTATTTFGDNAFSTKCLGKVSKQGAVCSECRSTRKCLQTRMSQTRKLRLNVPKKQLKATRLKLAKQKVARLQNRVSTMEKQLTAMEAKNAEISE